MSIDQIQTAIAPLRTSLLEHRLYQRIGSAKALCTFMEHHVFAVWDFMSLLKALQRQLCCVTIPWIPTGSRLGSRFINEIVLGEESDEDGHGGFASHFELYHRSMTRFGASTEAIDRLLKNLQAGHALEESFDRAEINQPLRAFVCHTFEVIESRDLCRIAAEFTFGREDLLPDIFQRIVDEIDRETQGGLAEFKYYLLRHVDLDGDEHGPMATRLVSELCGNNSARWETARQAAVAALESRLKLWDAIEACL